MEDGKTPVEAVGELNWQRMMTVALQFVGGGLVALHEQGSPAKAPEREDAQERDIRERLVGLGIRTDHADTIRRGWTSRSSPPPNVQARPIPTMSFEEFAAAVSRLDAAGGHPAAPQGANAPGTAEAQRAEPPRPEPPRPEPSHADGVGRSRAAEIHNEYMELRLSALEAKVHEIQLLIMTLASAPAAVSAAPTAESDATLDAPPSAVPSSSSIASHPGAALGVTPSVAQPFDSLTKQSAAALGIASTPDTIVNQSTAAQGAARSAVPKSDGIATQSAAVVGAAQSAMPRSNGITMQSTAALDGAPSSDRVVTQFAVGLGARPSVSPSIDGVATQSGAALVAAPSSDSIGSRAAGALGAGSSAPSGTATLPGVSRQDERAPIHRSNPGRSSPARTAGPAAGSGVPVVVEDRVAVEERFAAPEAAGENTCPAAQLGDAARETVVQGPWASGRASPGDGAATVSPEEPGCVYDVYERRVAAIERTFESFESMVEGLAARSRGKGPPSE